VPRRAAFIMQADIARAIRAAKQAGAAEVEVVFGGDTKIIVRLTSSTSDDLPLNDGREIIL
jgi:hypothetical protein